MEKLETIMKLISFYQSNTYKELVFYEKLNEKLSDYQILIIIWNVIAKAYEEKEKDVDELSRTLSSDIIENITVIIEFLTIKQIINLNNHLIINSLGRIPEEDIDVLDDDQTSIDFDYVTRVSAMPKEFWLCQRVLAMPKRFRLCQKSFGYAKELQICQKILIIVNTIYI
ncbi:2133_t:CDS:2, partial [Ambispora leptoticha]